jgi:hypothetical protein
MADMISQTASKKKINELVKENLVTQQEAHANAPNPNALQSLFDGLDIN